MAPLHLMRGRVCALPLLLLLGAAQWASAAVPTAPREVTIEPSTSRDLVLSWRAPRSDGGPSITAYKYRVSVLFEGAIVKDPPSPAFEETGRLLTSDGSATTDVVTGHSLAGLRYMYQIAAENSDGLGAWSEVVVGVPLDIPGGPSAVVAESVDGGLVAHWQPPMDKGGALDSQLDYTVDWWSRDDTQNVSNSGVLANGVTNYTISGLTNGTTYAVRVFAKSAAGQGRGTEATGTPNAFDLDVDNSGAADGTDGILLVRYLAGKRGEALRENLNLNEFAFMIVKLNLVNSAASLDVDGVNGATLSDGILIARYVLGVTSGAGLYAGQAAASKESTIITNIRNLMP
ncbi:MAG: fibronectin type III domain-containing protein [Gammaproteobacteria bacterium]